MYDVVFVFVFVYVCNAITFDSPNSSFSHIRYIFKGIRVMFVYESYRVNIKVTGAKVVQNRYSHNVKFLSAITPVL